MLRRGSHTARTGSFTTRPTVTHRSWFSKYMPTLNSRALTSKGSRNSELITTGLGGRDPSDGHLRGPLGPYSDISKATFNDAYGPDTIHESGGDAFDFALSPQESPKSPGAVHLQADREKGITVATDIKIEHAGQRR